MMGELEGSLLSSGVLARAPRLPDRHAASEPWRRAPSRTRLLRDARAGSPRGARNTRHLRSAGAAPLVSRRRRRTHRRRGPAWPPSYRGPPFSSGCRGPCAPICRAAALLAAWSGLSPPARRAAAADRDAPCRLRRAAARASLPGAGSRTGRLRARSGRMAAGSHAPVSPPRCVPAPGAWHKSLAAGVARDCSWGAARGGDQALPTERLSCGARCRSFTGTFCSGTPEPGLYSLSTPTPTRPSRGIARPTGLCSFLR